MKTFREFLHEISPIERDSNLHHMVRDRPGQAGPDPVVQKELRNTGVLHRVAKAAQKPGISRLKSKARRLLSK